MRIQDLLEYQFETNRVEQKFNGKLKPVYNMKSHEINRGSQAAVKADKKDPHMVKKYNIRTYHDDDRPHRDSPKRKDDGFNQFINYLIDNKLMGVNPHFPRVYDIKTITDKEGYRIYTYTVEKLLESTSISKEELQSFIENQLHPDTIWIDPDVAEYGSDEDWLIEAWHRLTKRLHLCITQMSTARETIKSETLMEAVKLLHKLDKEFPEQLDVHMNNMMWRRTQHGVVLVFNDPIF